MYRVIDPETGLPDEPVDLKTIARLAREGCLTPDSLVIEVGTWHAVMAAELPVLRDEFRTPDTTESVAIPLTFSHRWRVFGWIILSLLLCFPIGYAVMWFCPTWRTEVKWVLTIGTAVLLPIFFLKRPMRSS